MQKFLFFVVVLLFAVYGAQAATHVVTTVGSDHMGSRRRIHDLRLAMTPKHWGITDFYTHNVRDFEDVGFQFCKRYDRKAGEQ